MSAGGTAVTQLDAAVEFATNPEPRCACVLLLDTSGSMAGRPVEALNEGLAAFARDLGGDALARQRVEVSIVTFGGEVEVVQDFVTAGQYEATRLQAGGGTPMGAGIEKALDLIEARKAEYRTNGIVYYRPWVFMITDGAPTDEWKAAATRIRETEEASGVAFFAVGVDGADIGVLEELSVRAPLRLQGLKFVELFVWLSQSQRSVSTSKPGDQTALPAVDGWAVV
ncbi:MAG: vWA domain-containing protein [Acidimicrobiales bacterium]